MEKEVRSVKDFCKVFNIKYKKKKKNKIRISNKNNNRVNALISRCYELRSFELDLYWKRATYFWGFIIAIFTAYFITFDKDYDSLNKNYRLIINGVGIIFSIAYYLVNKGSTYWAGHWERMIDSFEKINKTPLYLINQKEDNPEQLLSSYPYSVSRINNFISLFLICIWTFLYINQLYTTYYTILNGNILCVSDYRQILITIIFIIVAIFLFLKTKTSKGSNYEFYIRNSKFISK